MIEVKELVKSYHNRLALDIPSFRFQKSGRYCLLGPNGSGKSTFLRILAGTLCPDGGQVSIPDSLNHDRGYMPQFPYAFGMSVLKNVTLAMGKLSKKEAEERAKKALDKLGIYHLRDAPGSKLSGGEQQRMALARMIACERPLLLLDEPTSSTDLAGSRLVENALSDYLRNGCTLIMATHAAVFAERTTDTALFFDGGRIAAHGAVHDVLNLPLG